MRWSLLALVLAAVVSSLGLSAAAGRTTVPTLRQLVGQRLIVALRGTTPSAALLARIGKGEVGGVILFGGNVVGPGQVRDLTDALRAAARAGGQPLPLVVADQEGGATRRLRWAPPRLSAAGLGRLSPAAVQAQGAATADALRAVGVAVDLAPVVDVPSVRTSFIAAQGRAFSAEPQRVATLAAAFTAGLANGGVAATAKHFPGLGRAGVSTDVAAVTVSASRAQLEADLTPYRRLIGSGISLVMLSNATYTALDDKPAAWSPAIEALLRKELGFTGVTITDALDAAGPTHGRSVGAAAVLAAQSGADLLLVAGSEPVSAAVYARLLAAAEAGRIPRRGLERSYARILALKRTLA